VDGSRFALGGWPAACSGLRLVWAVGRPVFLWLVGFMLWSVGRLVGWSVGVFSRWLAFVRLGAGRHLAVGGQAVRVDSSRLADVANLDHLGPFVLPVETVTPSRQGRVDLYLPAETEPPRPAIVFVHGGPVPAGQSPTPRDWPLFQGYGSLAAAHGCVGVTVDHRLHDIAAYPVAADDVAEAVQTARDDPRVDGDRIAIWFFSGGGLLSADWLGKPPEWLRCVAATYPVLAPPPGWPVDPRFRPVDAVGRAGALPIVLTRVGLEHPGIAATVEAFVAAARACDARLEIVDVPHGHHTFDVLDDTAESRSAIEQAFGAVLANLA
jgi:acetyl esterase/lipase